MKYIHQDKKTFFIFILTFFIRIFFNPLNLFFLGFLTVDIPEIQNFDEQNFDDQSFVHRIKIFFGYHETEKAILLALLTTLATTNVYDFFFSCSAMLVSASVSYLLHFYKQSLPKDYNPETLQDYEKLFYSAESSFEFVIYYSFYGCVFSGICIIAKSIYTYYFN